MRKIKNLIISTAQMSLNSTSDSNNSKPCANSTEIEKDLVSKLIEECKSNDNQVYGPALPEIYHVLDKGNEELFDELLKNNIIELLIPRLKETESTEVRFDAARSINKILDRKRIHITILWEESVILGLIRMMNDSNDFMVRESIYLLSNIIDSGYKKRNFVLKNGILSTISQLISVHFSNKEIMFAFSKLIYNICYYEGSSVINSKYLSTIKEILSSLIDYRKDLEIYNETAAILDLVRAFLEDLDEVFDEGILQKILPLLEKDDSSQENILHICAIFAAESSQKIQCLLDMDLFDYLKPLIASEDEITRRALYYLLSEISKGTSDQAMALFSLDIFPQIMRHIKEDPSSMKCDAFVIISNVLRSCNRKKAKVFINSDLFLSMRSVLQEPFDFIYSVVLEILVKLLKLFSSQEQQNNICRKIEKAGLIKHIENLRKSKNRTLCDLSQNILEIYASFKSSEKNNSE